MTFNALFCIFIFPAVCCGHSAVISALLNHEADRNIPDADGLTPEQTTDDSDIHTLLNSHVT